MWSLCAKDSRVRLGAGLLGSREKRKVACPVCLVALGREEDVGVQGRGLATCSAPLTARLLPHAPFLKPRPSSADSTFLPLSCPALLLTPRPSHGVLSRASSSPLLSHAPPYPHAPPFPRPALLPLDSLRPTVRQQLSGSSRPREAALRRSGRAGRGLGAQWEPAGSHRCGRGPRGHAAGLLGRGVVSRYGDRVRLEVQGWVVLLRPGSAPVVLELSMALFPGGSSLMTLYGCFRRVLEGQWRENWAL